MHFPQSDCLCAKLSQSCISCVYDQMRAVMVVAPLLLLSFVSSHVHGLVSSFVKESHFRHVMNEFIEKVPKAELHVHIEGTLEPEMMLQLASRNGLPSPFPNANAAREAYNFTNLQSFLDLYYLGASVLVKEEDFYELSMAYFKKAASDGVVHVELFFDPQTHLARNITFPTFFGGLHSAAQEAKLTLGLDVGLIMCFRRDLAEESALEALGLALPFRDHILGVGLDSGEAGRPPSLFSRVFAAARRLGFKAVAHAGEEGGAENVWEAIDELKVDRVDHGIHALDDSKLIAELEKRRMPLTTCPLSNLRLKVFENEDAEARTLGFLFLGTKIVGTINSDDPAYFGGYLADNYKKVQWILELSLEQVAELAIRSFEASFISESKRFFYIAAVRKNLKDAIQKLQLGGRSM